MRTSTIHFARLIELYRYFPFWTATALTLHESGRVLLNPYGLPSYAQAGEDRLLNSYLDMSRAGFYVDVGCGHPFRGSNTLNVYSRGWRGLVIDGNEEMIHLFQRFRPPDIPICSVGSNTEKRISFAITQVPELSTVCPAFEEKWGNSSGGVVKRVEGNATTLQTLFQKHQIPHSFDLLSIDVESHDEEVLTSFDIEDYRPRVIVIEMHDFKPLRSSSHVITSYLDSHGYELVGYTVYNGIFLDTLPARGAAPEGETPAL
jgi:hypothetical protein